MAKQLKISACTANYGHADLFKVMDRLAELGFEGAEINVMYHAVPKETSLGRRNEIRRHAADAGLKISALHFIFEPGMEPGIAPSVLEELLVANIKAVLMRVSTGSSELPLPGEILGPDGPKQLTGEVKFLGFDGSLRSP